MRSRGSRGLAADGGTCPTGSRTGRASGASGDAGATTAPGQPRCACGAKRTILIEILGLPLAASVESAKPHDVQSARRILKDQLDAPPAQQPKLPGLQAIVADRGYTGLAALANSHGLNLDLKRPPAAPMLPPAKPGGKPTNGKRTVTPLRPLYKVENTFARLGMWRRLSRCYEQTALGAQTWLEVACVAYLCGRLRIEPT